MIKIASIFSSVILLFIASYFYDAQQVSIVPSLPSAIKPGEEFTVELTISKGDITGFANLQQYLPEGFHATPLETANAIFSFAQQRVKFTWIDLPKDKSFKISYKVKTDSSCNGLKTLNGEFLYIESEKPKTVSLTPSVIVLNDDVPLTNAMLEELNQEIKVEKSVERSAPNADDYMVKLVVRKGSKRTAARMFDQLLDGYKADVIDAHGAQFSVANRLAEFYWQELPADTVFTVSYHLVPETSKPLANYAPGLPSVDEDRPEDDCVTCSSTPSFSNTTATVEKAKPSQLSYVTIQAPQKGIYYKVQIAATRKSPDRTTDFFHKKYKINEKVDLTMHEGWKKYLIGTFDKYASAKQHRVETQSKVSDAFVVAYNDGERIPVKDALKLNRRNQ